MKKITFIANGKLKKKLKIQKLLSNFFDSDFKMEILMTQKHGEAIELAKQATEQKTDYLISIGGDGTTNEVINGFLLANAEAQKNVILGLLPFGTGNDFARSLKLNNSIECLQTLINQNKIRPIDVGEVEYESFDGTRKKRYFNNVSQIGVGAETVKIVNGNPKYLGPALTFINATIKAFLRYKHQEINLVSDNFNFSGKIVSLCFANGKYMGGGLGIAPHAKIDDGELGMVVIGNVSVFEFVKYIPTLRKTQFIKHPEVQYLSIKNCYIESTNQQKYPVEMDGEYIGLTPMKVKVHYRKINFLME